jgi:uroporphyrin-III C-methyltransferase
MKQPLVIYMGLSRLSEIVSRLIAGGMPDKTRLALIFEATLPQQKVLEMMLSDALAFAQREAATAPALVVIGEIVGLRDVLLKHLQAP